MPTYHYPEELECYQLGRKFRTSIAKLCKKLPKEEEFRLKDQMLRAARSITNNIAEGFGRHHTRENMQFCRISRGSLMEMRDHLLTCVDENFFEEAEVEPFLISMEETLESLNGYLAYLTRHKSNQPSAINNQP